MVRRDLVEVRMNARGGSRSFSFFSPSFSHPLSSFPPFMKTIDWKGIGGEGEGRSSTTVLAITQRSRHKFPLPPPRGKISCSPLLKRHYFHTATLPLKGLSLLTTALGHIILVAISLISGGKGKEEALQGPKRLAGVHERRK